MKAKKFDCMALQHRGASEIYEETKGMTIPEELAYWQRYTEEFRQLQQQRQQANPKGVSTTQ